MNTQIKAIIALIIFLYSCQGGSKNENPLFIGETVVINEFPKTVKLEGKQIELTSFGAENMYLVDTFLVFASSKLDTFYSIYSTNSKKHVINLIPKGRGANETPGVVSPLFHEKDDNGDLKIFFQDRVYNCISALNLTRSIREKKTCIERSLCPLPEPGMFGIFPISDSLMFYHYFNLGDRKEYYATYNKQLQKFSQNDSISRYKLPNTGDMFLLNAYTKFQPRQQRYASAMHFLNQINIYSLKNKEMKCIVFQNVSDLQAVGKCPMPNKYEYYVDLVATEEKLFALYANQTRKTWALENKPAEIHVFDWMGKPLYKVTLDEKILKIAIDKQKNSLYGMTAEEKIYQYDIKKLVQ